MQDEKFIRERITKLRLNKNVSEYRMSLDLGHSDSYIRNITSGKALPSMSEFLYICEYLGVTPKEFFDEDMNPHEKNQKVTEAIIDIFNDYIRSKKDLEFNFYCHRSNIYKGFELGIHYISSFKNRPISENILILKK